MARAKLDRIDRHILSDLQSKGRMTNVELAERAGISAPPCLRRVRALERAGVIKGYHAELSPETLGYSVSVFALVGLNSQAETDLKSFEDLVAKWDEVRECHILAAGTATLFTNDATFMMLKPSVISVVLGVVMLRRGWMNRYMPPIAVATMADIGTIFGFVWAGLMFLTAALNVGLALTLDTKA